MMLSPYDRVTGAPLSRVCEVLKKRRIELGLSQEDIGAALGLGRKSGYVSRLESGREPRFIRACLYAYALGWTPTDLAREAGIPVVADDARARV